MRISLLFIPLMLGSIACAEKPGPELLPGAWKVDSTYTYYNGFGYTQREEGSDWATYVYGRDGVMKEIKYGSFQSYFYEFRDKDTLLVRSTQGGSESIFEVRHLDTDRMVLKKSKKPIFSSNGNQERYEIRYFSRAEMPEETALPFSDPRK